MSSLVFEDLINPFFARCCFPCQRRVWICVIKQVSLETSLQDWHVHVTRVGVGSPLSFQGTSSFLKKRPEQRGHPFLTFHVWLCPSSHGAVQFQFPKLWNQLLLILLQQISGTRATCGDRTWALGKPDPKWLSSRTG